MNDDFYHALQTGTERISVWADLLDRINVFPVADGDTGRNLLISLLPLKSSLRDRPAIVEKLFVSARGNSGNIAAQFFTGFLSYEDSGQLAPAVEEGTKRAWQAIADPRPGTMLSVFDELKHAVKESALDNSGMWVPGVLKRLQAAVSQTTQTLPVLKNAHVVDSGALGMFIFFDAFLNALYTKDPQFAPVHDLFREYLTVQETWSGAGESGACVDAVVQLSGKELKSGQSMEKLSALGESIISQAYEGRIKIHIHTRDQSAIRSALSREGSIIQWSEDDLEAQTKEFSSVRVSQALHIVTDAAGSMTREQAKKFGVTLLDSYITVGRKDAPETYIDRTELYQAMRKGIKVTTSQASIFERHQHYEKILSLYGTALYLCVGSVFTGNYRVVMDWKKKHDPENRLKAVDTGAASGRLGIIAAASARFARTASSEKEVLDYAAHAVSSAEEYIFLDTLRFLAAGGRLSKTSAVFGNMLRLKPVVSPLPDGAKKVGVVRNKKNQIAFAMEKLMKASRGNGQPLIMLEYTDNQAWVEKEIASVVKTSFPDAEIILQPLSLTTGVHTGPGTWGIAFLPR